MTLSDMFMSVSLSVHGQKSDSSFIKVYREFGRRASRHRRKFTSDGVINAMFLG